MTKYSATTPSNRPNKVGWYETHKSHSRLAKSTRSDIVLIGDSIIAGLKRYNDVWQQHFAKTLNFGISSDKTQHVLMRAQQITFSSSVKYIIIHCGTNNIDSDNPYSISAVTAGGAGGARAPPTIFKTQIF